jgi:hypothetical protein
VNVLHWRTKEQIFSVKRICSRMLKYNIFSSVLFNKLYKNMTYTSTFFTTRNTYRDGFLKQAAQAQSQSRFTTHVQSVCLGIEHPCGTCDQILFPVKMLLSEIYGLVSVGRPLWREDGSAMCSVITQWSESLRTRIHTLLSHLRLLQPAGPGSRIYIPQEQGGPVIPPALGSLYVVR